MATSIHLLRISARSASFAHVSMVTATRSFRHSVLPHTITCICNLQFCKDIQQSLYSHIDPLVSMHSTKAFFNPVSIWRWVVNSMPQPCYTCQGSPQYSPLNRMIGGSHIPSGCLGKECSKSNHNYIRHSIQSLKKSWNLDVRYVSSFVCHLPGHWCLNYKFSGFCRCQMMGFWVLSPQRISLFWQFRGYCSLNCLIVLSQSLQNSN